MISSTKCYCGCRSFFNFSYRSWHLLVDSAGLRWAKFPVAIWNLSSRRHSPSRSYGPQFCFPNDLSLKGESRSNPGWRRKILRTRRGNQSNTSIKFCMKTNNSLLVAVVILSIFASSAFATLRPPYPSKASPPDLISPIGEERNDWVGTPLRKSK